MSTHPLFSSAPATRVTGNVAQGGMGGSAVSVGSSAGGAGMGGAIFTHGDARNLTGKLMVYCRPTRHDQKLPLGIHAREEFLTYRRTVCQTGGCSRRAGSPGSSDILPHGARSLWLSRDALGRSVPICIKELQTQ